MRCVRFVGGGPVGCMVGVAGSREQVLRQVIIATLPAGSAGSRRADRDIAWFLLFITGEYEVRDAHGRTHDLRRFKVYVHGPSVWLVEWQGKVHVR